MWVGVEDGRIHVLSWTDGVRLEVIGFEGPGVVFGVQCCHVVLGRAPSQSHVEGVLVRVDVGHEAVHVFVVDGRIGVLEIGSKRHQ